MRISSTSGKGGGGGRKFHYTADEEVKFKRTAVTRELLPLLAEVLADMVDPDTRLQAPTDSATGSPGAVKAVRKGGVQDDAAELLQRSRAARLRHLAGKLRSTPPAAEGG